MCVSTTSTQGQLNETKRGGDVTRIEPNKHRTLKHMFFSRVIR